MDCSSALRRRDRHRRQPRRPGRPRGPGVSSATSVPRSRASRRTSISTTSSTATAASCCPSAASAARSRPWPGDRTAGSTPRHHLELDDQLRRQVRRSPAALQRRLRRRVRRRRQDRHPDPGATSASIQSLIVSPTNDLPVVAGSAEVGSGTADRRGTLRRRPLDAPTHRRTCARNGPARQRPPDTRRKALRAGRSVDERSAVDDGGWTPDQCSRRSSAQAGRRCRNDGDVVPFNASARRTVAATVGCSFRIFRGVRVGERCGRGRLELLDAGVSCRRPR